MPKIYLYAEILVNIRQLTLHASLQTEKKEGTKIDVSTDKRVITVTHDGETQHLYLPTQIKGDASITFPLQKATDISARVQIEDEHEWKCLVSNEIETPWAATDLERLTQLHCRHCKNVVLPANKIKQWKALPSENWAELMDFWFCHKPHDEDTNEDAADSKGFSSKSKLAIEPGVGMTDLLSIALHADDCLSIKAAETRNNPASTVLRCSQCTSMLGVTSPDEDMIRLHKSSLAIYSDYDAKYLWYPSSIFICAQLLSLIEATALKRFLVHSVQPQDDATDSDPLLLWIFNPDIYYSCSAFDGNGVLTKISSTDAPINSTTRSEVAQNYSGGTQDASMSLDHPVEDEKPLEKMETDPHRDNVSQIHGLPSQTRVVIEDLNFDVPLRSINSPDKGPIATSSRSFSDTKPLFLSEGSREYTNMTESATPENHARTNHGNEHMNLVHRAAKIFYQTLPPGTDVVKYLDANSTTHEELFLPDPLDLKSLRATLKDTTAMLPASARTFQEWSVGLLNRYEKSPSGLGVMQENPLARGIQSRDGRVTRWDLGHGAEGLYA